MTIPTGAIISEIELLRLGAGQSFYVVLNLGRSSSMSEYIVTTRSKIETTEWGTRRFIANLLSNGWFVYCDHPVSLLDHNIGGGGWNRHFLFTSKGDAEAYLAEALQDMDEDRRYRDRCEATADYEFPDDYDDEL